MVKHSYWKNFLREIRHSLSRFLAIFAIVALGVGFLAGLMSTAPDMRHTLDEFFDQADLMDIRVVSTLGLTDQDVDAVRTTAGVQAVMPSYALDALVLPNGQDEMTAHITSLPFDEQATYLNKVTLIEGRLPAATDECVIQLEKKGTPAKIGDMIRLSTDSAGEADPAGRNSQAAAADALTVKAFTVVGIINSPLYFSMEREASTVGNGIVNLVMLVGEDAFSMEAYTDLYIQVTDAKSLNTFSSSYGQAVAPVSEKLETLGETQVVVRRDDLVREATVELDQAKAELAQEKRDAEQKLADARRELDESRAKIADGEQELTGGKTQLAEARQQLADGEQAYSEAQTEIDEKLGKAQAEIDQAELDIAGIELPEWYVLDRQTIVSYASFEGNASKVEAIAQVFPIFFFLVAALVALTTMTRLVEEQRTQIGTLKALGYSKGAIAAKYLLYAGAASVLGSLAGLAVGLWIFPTVIYNAYGIMYFLPDLIIGLNIPYALIASLAAIFCTMLATWSACYESLKGNPASLMLPRAPKPGKRVFLEKIPLIWSRLGFTTKVTIRNLLRYKKRFFMTVFGIAGCTALLLAGFGLRDAIGDIVDKQFTDIYQYNLTIDAKQADAFESADLMSIIHDSVTASLPVHQENGQISLGGKDNAVIIFVPEQSTDLGNFITLRNRKSAQVLTLDASTVILTEKLAETLGAKAGSRVLLENTDGQQATLTVGAITENYVYNYVYLSADLYESSYGVSPEYRRLLCKTDSTAQADRDTLTTALLKNEMISAVQFNTSVIETFANILGNIDYIVIVLIVTAGILAFVVLYNLTNINIAEREREIATIKVLGFFDREVSAYIYRETAVLTLIGIGIGLILGIALNAFVVRTAEVDMVMFGRTIKPISFVLAALITLFFSFLVNLVMHRKLKRVDIVSSMKAVE